MAFIHAYKPCHCIVKLKHFVYVVVHLTYSQFFMALVVWFESYLIKLAASMLLMNVEDDYFGFNYEVSLT